MSENNEESYSMYPKTSSPPPPHANMHFPMYQSPVPMYAYPQNPYMYATGPTQAPSYHFKLMNQNQVMYQNGGSIPQQNSTPSTLKKKWNNNNNITNNTGTNGSTNVAKSHTYYPGQSQAYYPASSMNKNNSATAAYDPYKFDVSKISYEEMKKDFPVFINTDADEFVKARAKRHELRLKMLSSKEKLIVSTKKEKKEDNKVEVESKAEIEEIPEMEETTIASELVEDKAEEKSSKIVKPKVQESDASHKKTEKHKKKEKREEEVKKSNSTTPSPSATPVSTATPSTPPIVAPAPTKQQPVTKSWSAIASSGIAKSKPASISRPASSNYSTPLPSPLHTPQKKDTRYVPPSTKGAEPLGSVTLRMCFDPDYIGYVLKKDSENDLLPLKSIFPRGIINTANVCFLSSVLQVLLYCQPFIDVLNVLSTRNVHSRIASSQSKLLDACITIYKQFDRENFLESKKRQQSVEDEIEDNEKTPTYGSVIDAINPDEFYRTISTIPKFKDLQWGQQEDAEEFLTHLLDQLHEELVASINLLSENEIQNILQSINDQELKVFFIRNLSRFKKSEFLNNASVQLQELISKYGNASEENEEDGWHEVSSSGKRSKKNKTAAKRTVEVIPSPISKLFGGQFRSVLDIPNNKERQSITLDPFQTIQLDISDSSVIDLEGAFKKFSEFELIPFRTSSGTDVEAKKQTFIDKLPEVLLIQLKRFSFVSNVGKSNDMTNYNAYNGRIEKIRKKINYGHELIIPSESVSSNATMSNREYSLTGVIYHHGLSPDGGHYTADVLHSESKKWYRIDDVNINELEEDDVLKGGEEDNDSRTAYILMYQKK
ncbi:hypothetical protein KAFR_0B02370 [Kazachstania africana CBS 2517]|uniref:Ubiquitin carboxyl-terminal hydrolase n=1 Tax=Kazachstania africana (strain ATCC 22294 / BCRC 22015 / CBS 2517 / CECT 1963 / NBRC 1671 / NRRL Y-8276) TaxID=1071382 RepID=H2AQ85_KAZAF|nr:hypothetical protein KAFR_0B02370 [Kazachstania africana CBS 2517]CCF56535.1 hypothetical protein KAFR_0B02370 [Kazachstania africana CBS 2517]